MKIMNIHISSRVNFQYAGRIADLRATILLKFNSQPFFGVYIVD